MSTSAAGIGLRFAGTCARVHRSSPAARDRLFFAALAVAPFAAAQAQTDQQLIVDRATKTVGDLTHDKAFGNTRQLLGQMMRDTTDAR